MKETPILFSGPMAKAINDGRKTMTRRVVKPTSRDADGIAVYTQDDQGVIEVVNAFEGEPIDAEPIVCPYGKTGDRLWVRETFYIDHCCYTKGPLPKEKPNEIEDMIYYRANGTCCEQIPECCCGEYDRPTPWRPSIHMPRWASRILLEIENVRVERLQEISDGAIVAEGLDDYLMLDMISRRAKKYKTKPEYWIGGWDEGSSYCRECGEKKVTELLQQKPNEDYFLAGGYRIEGDSQAFCETCECALNNAYTNYCCETELNHFEEYGFNPNSPDDCHSLYEILIASSEGELRSRLNRLSWRILWDSINTKRGYGWDVNPWVWVIEFKRG